jgi:type II secretory pathway component GspD/PulD (secretin)
MVIFAFFGGFSPLLVHGQDKKTDAPEGKKDDDAKKKSSKDDDDAKKKLEETTITLQVKDKPLGEVLASVAGQVGLNFVVDPAVASLKVNASFQKMPFTEAFPFFGELAGAQYEIWRGCIFVTSKKKPLAAPPAPKLSDEAAKAYDTKVLESIDWTKKPLAQVAKELTEKSGIPFKVASGVTATIDLKLSNVTLGVVADAVCRVAGLELVRSGKDNVFKKH